MKPVHFLGILSIFCWCAAVIRDIRHMTNNYGNGNGVVCE